MTRINCLLRATLLVAYVMAHVGFPIFELSPSADDSPYPCRGHECGCGSADACWQRCCCMSLGQRLAWAARNRVTPPQGLAERQVALKCADNTQPGTKCCESHEAQRDASSETSRPAKKHDLALAIQALKCRGHATYWFSASEPALATNASLSYHVDLANVGLVCVANDSFDTWRDVPPVPPG